MYFTKYPHRANFSYVEVYDQEIGQICAGRRVFEVERNSYEGEIHHLRITNPAVWAPNESLASLILPSESDGSQFQITDGFRLEVRGSNHSILLNGQFGVSGDASIFSFDLEPGARFYGMGQKLFGEIELSGYRTKFWNTDVWGDFNRGQWRNKPSDPPYFSTPYVIVRVGTEYVGFLMHTPYPVFMETPGTDESRVFVHWQRTGKGLIIGSEGGEPNLWIFHGPSLRELTQKLQSLVGKTPRPPIWSLGYHQSRWGYAGHDDLVRLDHELEKHEIPCSGLWLDIDYLDGYRVFQCDPKSFPEGIHKTKEVLKRNGRRIVPIIDPGVKFEPGYRVYDDGHKEDVFCRNAEGTEFVGTVWPGETVFPDFTLSRVRNWWAGYVKEFIDSGFESCWIDMNDPSTGPVDPQGMLFDHGKVRHETHHNDYSYGMQEGTFQGFLKARPNERPFILSRSGYTGSSRYSAIWTGDNLSNYFYLQSSIATCVNMSLSGMPFVGADVGGFGDDVSDELMLDWTKAHFLFPFFRNHANKITREQEPFVFPEPVMSVLRHYIRLRYMLLPYLYNLFVEQETVGSPVLRPLFYEDEALGLDEINDQFFVGPSILQAPFVEERAKRRSVLLPGTEPWFDTSTGSWVSPGITELRRGRDTTPLYIRAGSIIPMQPEAPKGGVVDMVSVQLHLFLPENWTGEGSLEYVADDGLSFNYRDGQTSKIKVRFVALEGNVAIAVDHLESGFEAIVPTIVLHGVAKSVRINGRDTSLRKNRVTLTGKALPVQVVNMR
jgi:alpha-glucosidase